MKKTTLIFLAFSLVGLSSCTTAPEKDNKNSTSESENTVKTAIFLSENSVRTYRIQRNIGPFHFDQSSEEFLNALNEKEGYVPLPNPNFPDTPDGRTVEWDGVFSYASKDIRATFSPQENIIGLSAISSRYATEKGLKVGDSKDKMIKLYGTNYTQDEYGRWYNYADPEDSDFVIGFLMDEYEENLIDWWCIYIPSKQSEEP